MSLIVTLYVPEGMVMAGDSRLTLDWTTKTKAGIEMHSVPSSDSNTKIFSMGKRFGLGTFGAADIQGIPISGFISQFTEEKMTDETTIDQMPELLIDFFGREHGYPATDFYVIGYKVEEGISTPHAYHVDIAQKKFERINYEDETVNGAEWGGQTDVLTRLLSTVKIKKRGLWIDQPFTPIPWNYMTLQDAIDFATYAVRTTIETIRFQQKEKTVGGPIDILVLRPNEEPLWISKKVFKAQSTA